MNTEKKTSYESNKNITAEDILRRRTLKSIFQIKNDEELTPYLKETIAEIATFYGKDPTDFSMEDFKRCIDDVFNLCKKLNIEQLNLSKILKVKDISGNVGELSSLYTLSRAIAGIAYGQFGYLAWHITKEVSKPKLKRSASVYICGLLANSLYGGNINEVKVKIRYIDPIFEALDRHSINIIAGQLEIKDFNTQEEAALLEKISQKISSEGKDQSISRAWFPKDAESYIEVLVTVSKKINLDIHGLNSVEEIETAISTKIFSDIWKDLPPEKKIELAEKFKKENPNFSPEYISSMMGLGTIGIANLSGFSTYIAASTSMSFIASSLGLSIPFAGYTAMSATISAAIGPAGVAVVAFPAIFEYLRAKPERLIGVVLTIAAMRAKLNSSKIETPAKKGILKSIPVWGLAGMAFIIGCGFTYFVVAALGQ